MQKSDFPHTSCRDDYSRPGGGVAQNLESLQTGFAITRQNRGYLKPLEQNREQNAFWLNSSNIPVSGFCKMREEERCDRWGKEVGGRYLDVKQEFKSECSKPWGRQNAPARGLDIRLLQAPQPDEKTCLFR